MFLTIIIGIVIAMLNIILQTILNHDLVYVYEIYQKYYLDMWAGIIPQSDNVFMDNYFKT